MDGNELRREKVRRDFDQVYDLLHSSLSPSLLSHFSNSFCEKLFL